MGAQLNSGQGRRLRVPKTVVPPPQDNAFLWGKLRELLDGLDDSQVTAIVLHSKAWERTVGALCDWVDAQPTSGPARAYTAREFETGNRTVDRTTPDRASRLSAQRRQRGLPRDLQARRRSQRFRGVRHETVRSTRSAPVLDRWLLVEELAGCRHERLLVNGCSHRVLDCPYMPRKKPDAPTCAPGPNLPPPSNRKATPPPVDHLFNSGVVGVSEFLEHVRQGQCLCLSNCRPRRPSVLNGVALQLDALATLIDVENRPMRPAEGAAARGASTDREHPYTDLPHISADAGQLR
jgi:hypothetical protein